MSVAAKTREDTASMIRKHKFMVEIEETCVSKNFDETVRLQSEKRRVDMRDQRRGIAGGASSAPCLASSSSDSFSGRNECLGTHCSLIEPEKRENVLARD